MYDIGRKVFCKSQRRTGTIQERNRLNRRASYLVAFDDGTDYLTGSADLRGADYLCDSCSEWRTGPPAKTSEVRLGDGTVDDRFEFCFLCVREHS